MGILTPPEDNTDEEIVVTGALPKKGPSANPGKGTTPTHTTMYRVPEGVIVWIHLKHYASGFFGDKSKFSDEIYQKLYFAIAKTVSMAKGKEGTGGQTIFTLDWGTTVGTLPDGSLTNLMTVVGRHQQGSKDGQVVTAYPGPAVWP